MAAGHDGRTPSLATRLTVGRAAREELLKVLLLLGALRADERAGELVAEVEVVVEGGEHLVALPAQLRAVRAGRVVEARVHDARVALGRALANIVGGLDHDDGRGRLRELQRETRARARSVAIERQQADTLRESAEAEAQSCGG